MQHPYLFFSKEDVENYRIKIKNDAKASERYEKAVAEAGKYLSEELVSEEKANGGTSQHADFGLVSGQANRFCYVLGTKYLVDSDKRCAEKIRELLLHYITFERWCSGSYLNRTPVPWHSDLCSTAITLALGSLFDIVYDYLTPAERTAIARGIYEKGVLPAFSDWVLPEKRVHALDSMGHNWWAVCIGEAAVALLALRDELSEECGSMLALADEALADYLTYGGNALFNKFRNFDEQGFFYEGTGYNNFGTGSLLRYLWCRERCSGRNETIRSAVPEGLCDALMTFSYPVTRNGSTVYDYLNFGDSDVVSDYSFLLKYAYLTGIGGDSAKACLSGCKPDVREEIGGLSLDSVSGSFDGMPLTKVFSSGYAVARNSYAPDSTLFAVKSGFCWNHSHNDSGSFVIFHKGRPFFTDGGTCSYDSPLYHSYYCQDAAHSVLRVGGEGRRDEELYRGTKFPGKITDSFDGGDFFFVQADSAGPMAHLCSRMYRSFFWLDNRMLVIFDEVFCHSGNTLELTLHADADIEGHGNEAVFDNGISKARFVIRNAVTEYSVGRGHSARRENEDMPYAVFTTEEKKRAHFLISTLELDYDENPVEFRILESENAEGLSVDDGKTERRIWFNRLADGHIMHDNSNNVIDGFETDAYILMTTRDRQTASVRVFTVCGSYLRRSGEVLFSSFLKKTREISL